MRHLEHVAIKLLVLAALSCGTALADSYGVVTFEASDAEPYVTPLATIYGGTAGNGSYGASSAGQHEIEFSVFIAPDFPVHEVSFDVSYYPGSVIGAFLIVSDQIGAGTLAYGGTTHVDFVDPLGITTIYVYDEGYTPNSAAGISDIVLNPSLAPVASTPEPPSVALLGTALFGLGLALASRRKLEDVAGNVL